MRRGRRREGRERELGGGRGEGQLCRSADLSFSAGGLCADGDDGGEKKPQFFGCCPSVNSSKCGQRKVFVQSNILP